MEINRIYSGRPEDFHWAGFSSGSGAGIRHCAKAVQPPSFVVSDRLDAGLLNMPELAGIERFVLDGDAVCGSLHGPFGEKDREHYRRKSRMMDEVIVNQLHMFEERAGFRIDCILLDSYNRLVRQPLLDAYKDKIIGVHPANLACYDDDGKRRYVSRDAVLEAILAGEGGTCSSVIVVDSSLAHGEILGMGPKLEVWKPADRFSSGHRSWGRDSLPEWLSAYVDSHQLLQYEYSSLPAVAMMLQLIKNGRLALGAEKKWSKEWRPVYLDGEMKGRSGCGGEALT